MKWLPRSKKSLLLLLPVVILAAGLVYFIIWSGQKTTDALDNAKTEPVKEVKVDDILLTLKENKTLSEFNTFLGVADFGSRTVANEAGELPKLIVFAPTNAAFKKSDIAPLAVTPEPAKDELRFYHAAILYPAADGTSPSLDLAEGQNIQTLINRQLQVKKNGSSFILVDAKGRQAKVDRTYMTDKNGNRLYFIDSVLLLQ